MWERGRRRGEGQNDIKSFGIGRVAVKRAEDNTEAGEDIIYKQKRRRGKTSEFEFDGHSMMLGMIMGTLPRAAGIPLRKKKSATESERRVAFYRNEQHVW